jgi:hypothetical protein
VVAFLAGVRLSCPEYEFVGVDIRDGDGGAGDEEHGEFAESSSPEAVGGECGP